MYKRIILITALSLISLSLSQKSEAFSKFYTEDRKGLHLMVTGKTETGDSWTLREYQPKDFEDQWRIISDNTGEKEEKKLYNPVPAASKESVQERRNRSLQRFAKGNPWGIHSLLNDKGQCVLILGLGRKTGKEGPARWGHGNLGLTLDLKEAPKEYRRSLLTVLTTQLAPEIRRLGESLQVPERIHLNFTEDINPANEQGPYIDVGPLTHIDITCAPDQKDLREDLLATGFRYDKEGATDLRKETQYLRNSTFMTLEEDLLKSFQGKLVEYKRYIITGPEGKDIVIGNNPKWGGIKLCFVYDVPKKD